MRATEDGHGRTSSRKPLLIHDLFCAYTVKKGRDEDRTISPSVISASVLEAPRKPQGRVHHLPSAPRIVTIPSPSPTCLGRRPLGRPPVHPDTRRITRPVRTRSEVSLTHFSTAHSTMHTCHIRICARHVANSMDSRSLEMRHCADGPMPLGAGASQILLMYMLTTTGMVLV